ncbi:uncharacterized protein LOC100183718 [Ciona intestinalis]
MKTIDWGIVQIPLLRHYRVCFCLKRELKAAVGGTGWKLFLQSALRVLLLSMWGMTKIDYDLPQTEQKIIGIYVELAVLSLQVVDGLAAILSSWFENLYLIYPSLVVIPVCFLVDFLVKATCYGQLFLYPYVTAFGVFSLIEFWIRYLGLMYCWVALVSFVYMSRGKKNPFESEEKSVADATASRASSLRSPFSRSSTLSVRGRRSFLLRAKTNKPNDVLVDDGGRSTLLRNSFTSSENSSEQRRAEVQGTNPIVRLNSQDRPSSLRSSGTRGKSVSIDQSSFHRPSDTEEVVAPPRYKRKGGFVPPLLREQQPQENEILKESLNDDLSLQKPPSLPAQPPVGIIKNSIKKVKKSSQENKEEDCKQYKTQESFIV